MKTNSPSLSPLRQTLDILGAQIRQPVSFDPDTWRHAAKQLSIAAGDMKTPLPPDIFQPGIDDIIMRIALGAIANQFAGAALKAAMAQSQGKINGREP